MSWIGLGLAFPWVVVLLFISLGAWISVQLIRQNGRLLSRLETLEARLAKLAAAPVPTAQPEPAIQIPQSKTQNPPGMPIGSPAPAFELPDLCGERKSLADFLGRKLLLIFFNPRCGFCTRMAPDLAALPVEDAGGTPLPLVVSTGDPDDNRKLVEEHGIRCPVLLQEATEVGAPYQCHGTPMGYLIDAQGRIASEMAVGAPALLELAGGERGGRGDGAPGQTGGGQAALGGTRSLSDSKIERNGLPAGTPAPPFSLPLLSGGAVSLKQYQGRKLLLVFSSPQCGPCDQLMPRLEQAYRRSGDVPVLMISRDEPGLNHAKVEQHGLTFPIALQRQWEVSREYGMFATPVAYLIDENSIIAAAVAVGVEPILALLGSADPEAATAAAEVRCRCGQPPGQCGCGRREAAAAAARKNGA